MRGHGAEQCPEPMQLRVAVVARLGYDPFSATASKIVLVAIEQKGSELSARVDLANAEGSVQGVRELSAPLEHCFDLIRAMALSISIAIDPVGALARRDASDTPLRPEESNSWPASTTSSEEEKLPSEPALTSKPPPRRRAIRYFTGAGIHGTYGAAPAPGFGGDLILGGQYGGFSLSLEGRADALNMERFHSNAERGAYFLLASLVPCAHWGVGVFCALGTAGAIRASSGNITRSYSRAGAYGAIGARVGLEIPATESLTLGIHADLAAPWLQQKIHIIAEQDWTSPSVYGLVGSSLVVHY